LSLNQEIIVIVSKVYVSVVASMIIVAATVVSVSSATAAA